MRVAAAVVAAALVCACTGGEPERPAPASDSASSSAAPAPSPAPSAAPRSRPLALTVTAAGPPGALVGVDRARVVVEYPLSADRSGWLLLVDGTADVLGPLRAATPSDALLATGFSADLVTARTTAAVVDTVAGAGLAVVEEHGVPGGLQRDPARQAPFNLYAAPEVLRAALPERATPPPWEPSTAGSATATPSAPAAPGASAPPVAAADATGAGAHAEVTVRAAGAGTVTWTWDPAARRWLRTADGQLQQTATGERIGAGAVLVLEVAPPADRPPVVRDLTGSGAATLLGAGTVTTSTWRRGDGPLPGVDGAGAMAGVGMPQPTWIHICAAPCVTTAPAGAGPAPSVPATAAPAPATPRAP